MGNFFSELKKRNVYKTATAYAVTSWLILQIVDVVGPGLGWDESVTAFLLKILIVGFPIALVLAWLFELTPNGFKRTGTFQEDTADNKKAGRRLNYFIIGVLSIAVCLLLAERVFFAGSTDDRTKEEASLAILPFEYLSGNSELSYTARSIPTGIHDQLSLLSNLLVTSTTSSFGYQGSNTNTRDIAEDLKVVYLLEGTIMYERSRLRISARLVDAIKDKTLWTETIESESMDLYQIQDQLSRKVISNLQIQLLPEEDKALSTIPTENSEAYELFMRARQHISRMSDDEIAMAIDLMENALELDPDFAEAHALLSTLYTMRFFYGNLSKEERDLKTQHHLEMAIKLGPEKPEVLWARAFNNYRSGKDTTEVISDLRRVIDIKPSFPEAHQLLSAVLRSANQYNNGVYHLRRAQELDPKNPRHLMFLANTEFYQLNDPQQALKEIDNAILLDSSNLVVVLQKAAMLSLTPIGDLAGSFITYHRATKKNPYERPNPIIVYAMDLDLDPVAEKYSAIQQVQYPDNEDHTYPNVLKLYLIRKKYSEARDWVRLWEEEKGLSHEIAEMDLAIIEAHSGDYTTLMNLYSSQFQDFDHESMLP